MLCLTKQTHGSGLQHGLQLRATGFVVNWPTKSFLSPLNVASASLSGCCPQGCLIKEVDFLCSDKLGLVFFSINHGSEHFFDLTPGFGAAQGLISAPLALAISWHCSLIVHFCLSWSTVS